MFWIILFIVVIALIGNTILPLLGGILYVILKVVWFLLKIVVVIGGILFLGYIIFGLIL